MSDDDKRGCKGGPIIAVAVACLLLVSYVGGYFAVSEFTAAKAGNFRHFEESWQFAFFWPALKLEKCCRGELRVTWTVGGFYQTRQVD